MLNIINKPHTIPPDDRVTKYDKFVTINGDIENLYISIYEDTSKESVMYLIIYNTENAGIAFDTVWIGNNIIFHNLFDNSYEVSNINIKCELDVGLK